MTRGTYTPGQAIAFDGVQVTLSGTAGHGRFVRGGAEHQPERVHDGAEPRQRAERGDRQPGATQLSNAIAGVLNDLEQALIAGLDRPGQRRRRG